MSPKRAFTPLCAAVLLVALVILARRHGSAEPGAVVAPVIRVNTTRVALGSFAALQRRIATRTNRPSPVERPEVTEEPADEEADDAIPGLVRQVIKQDAALAEISYYRHRVLLDKYEQEQYRSLLADPWMFEKVQRDLVYPPEIHESPRENTKRLMEIDYLRDALAWKDNPERDAILQMLEEIVLIDNFRDDLGMDMRISIAGNKMELYGLLKEYSPAQAMALVEKSRDTRVGKLLAFIAAEVEAQERRERENSVSAL